MSLYANTYEQREAEIRLWEIGESTARVMGYPALVILGGLTGCKAKRYSDTVDCPVNNTEAYRKYQDNSLSTVLIDKIIAACSPRAQGFPRFNLIEPSQELTPECFEVLESVIPWKKNFNKKNTDTKIEKNLKKIFIKGVWASLFLYRVVPAKFSKDGLDCASLELDFFGSSGSLRPSLEHWREGFYINTKLLDTILNTGIDVGFMDNEVCSKKNKTLMYFSNEENMIGLCRTGGKLMADKSAFFSASTIVHEVRHSKKIFGAFSSHDSECDHGSKDNCDEGEYGAYGTELIFADQMIAGALLLLKEMTSSVEKKELYENVKEAVRVMCTSNSRVFLTENPLYHDLGTTKPCANKKIYKFLEETYGYSKKDVGLE